MRMRTIIHGVSGKVYTSDVGDDLTPSETHAALAEAAELFRDFKSVTKVVLTINGAETFFHPDNIECVFFEEVTD